MSQPPVPPLDALEERAWRALGRLMVVLPRAVDEDLQRTRGLSFTVYSVLMHLSMAPGGQLRMSELARLTALSPSRMTRAIDALVGEGQVERVRCGGDGRSTLATITGAGRQQLRDAWPDHLAAVRALVIDHLDATELDQLATVAERITSAVQARGTLGAPPGCPGQGREGAG